MPIRHKKEGKDQGWYWGSKGPFKTEKKALAVQGAAYASGYKEQKESLTKETIMELIDEIIQEEEGFSPSQTPAEADETSKECEKRVEKTVKPDPGVSKKLAAIRICMDTRKSEGAPLKRGEKYKKNLRQKRKGGKSK